MPNHKKTKLKNDICDNTQLVRRRVRLDGGYDAHAVTVHDLKEPLGTNNMHYLKQKAKAQIIQYWDTYRNNFEILQHRAHPKFKFRPPISMLPLIEPKKSKRNSRKSGKSKRSTTLHSSASTDTIMPSQRELAIDPSDELQLSGDGFIHNLYVYPNNSRAILTGIVEGHLTNASPERISTESTEYYFDIDSSSHS